MSYSCSDCVESIEISLNSFGIDTAPDPEQHDTDDGLETIACCVDMVLRDRRDLLEIVKMVKAGWHELHGESDQAIWLKMQAVLARVGA